MAQSTWLTDVADTMADYYGRIQPKYNAARNRQIKEAAIRDANNAFSGLLASEFPDASSFDPTEIKAREALTSGIPRGSLATAPQDFTPMFTQAPAIQAPEPVKASAPMLTMPNQMYAHEAADVARGLMPSGPVSAEYKQSGSSAGATPGQAQDSYDEYRRTASELSAKSKSLAISQARLEYMKRMAPSVKAQMFGTEEADSFDKEVENLSKEVEGDQAAQAKALIKKAELDQKIAVSSKQSEVQQAKIAVAKQAKQAADEWRKTNAEGKLRYQYAALLIRSLQEGIKNATEREGNFMKFAGSNAGAQMLFATSQVPSALKKIAEGDAILDRINSMGTGTKAKVLDEDKAKMDAAVTEYLHSIVQESEKNQFSMNPDQPAEGWSMFGMGPGSKTVKGGFVTENMPPSMKALLGDYSPLRDGDGGDYYVSSESGTGTAPASPTKSEKPHASKLGGGKKPDGGTKKATSPKVGDKNAEGKTWTGKRWL